MKLTKELLQKIIKEELDDLEEAWWNPFSKKEKEPEPEAEPEIEIEPEPEPEPMSAAENWSKELGFPVTDADIKDARRYDAAMFGRVGDNLKSSYALGHLDSQNGKKPSSQECYEAGVDCNKIRKRISGAGKYADEPEKRGGYGPGSSGYTTRKDWDSPFRESKLTKEILQKFIKEDIKQRGARKEKKK